MSRKLIVSIVLVSLLLLMIADFRINGVQIFEDYFRQLQTPSLDRLRLGEIGLPLDENKKASKESELTLDNPEIKLLEINNPMGSIRIQGEEREDLAVSYYLTVYADSKDLAEDLVQNLKLLDEFSEGKLVLALDKGEMGQGLRGYRLDYQIRVPRQMNLQINNGYGQVEVANIQGNVDLRNAHDSLYLSNLEGDAKVNVKYGNVLLENIEGKVDLITAYNKTEVYGVREQLDLTASYSRVYLQDIQGRAELETRYGSLFLKEMAQAINLEARYTEVTGEDLNGEFQGKLRAGDVELFNIKKGVEIAGQYTDLEIKLAPELQDYSLQAQTSYGEIISNLPQEVEETGKNQKSLQFKQGTGEIEINLQTNYADIKFYQ